MGWPSPQNAGRADICENGCQELASLCEIQQLGGTMEEQLQDLSWLLVEALREYLDSVAPERTMGLSRAVIQALWL
jgi:hypothetical protein